MREIASIRSYEDLQKAFRTRMDELEATNVTVDQVTGLASGHTGKLLGPGKAKRFGKLSLGAMLEATGVRLVMVTDADTEGRYRDQIRSPHKEQRRRNLPDATASVRKSARG